MTGWHALLKASVRLAKREGVRLARRPAAGRLLFEPAGTFEPAGRRPGAGRPLEDRERREAREHVRGIIAGGWSLSGEICGACGGPGDPVRGTDGSPATRCDRCRNDSDQVVSRPMPDRLREPGERPGALEDLLGTRDLRELMAAEHGPAAHRGWPVRIAPGDPHMETLGPIGAGGWNHLFRAAFRMLLPLECAGTRPWRLAVAKERLGRLRILSSPRSPIAEGVSAIAAGVSVTTCIFCGRPGRMRRDGWHHPACDDCERSGVERVQSV